MSAAYRAATLACPGCNEPLDPVHAGPSVIDRCPGCGGVWIDWDDGELGDMVKQMPEARTAARPSGPGSATCPRCRAALADERYGTSNAEILRCGECVGAFVPQGSIALLLVGKAPSTEPDEDRGFFALLLEKLRALTGASS
ncbi:MAG: zf-TFIIB domain-containing protein [Byssovorax sp.]